MVNLELVHQSQMDPKQRTILTAHKFEQSNIRGPNCGILVVMWIKLLTFWLPAQYINQWAIALTAQHSSVMLTAVMSCQVMTSY